MTRHFTLTLDCPERAGIVHAVTSFLVDHGCDIVEHQQFDDDVRSRLFLRTAFTCATADVDDLTREFAAVATEFEMEFELWDERPTRILVMVSKAGQAFDASGQLTEPAVGKQLHEFLGKFAAFAADGR